MAKEYSTYLMGLAAICVHFCQFSFFVYGPQFFYDVYGLSLTKSHFYSALPMLCAALGAPIGGFLVNFLRRRLNFQLSIKIVHTLGMLVPIANLLIVALSVDLM